MRLSVSKSSTIYADAIENDNGEIVAICFGPCGGGALLAGDIVERYNSANSPQARYPSESEIDKMAILNPGSFDIVANYVREKSELDSDSIRERSEYSRLTIDDIRKREEMRDL